MPDFILDAVRNLYYLSPYRAYTKKCQCIFIHIPKTAGTSILKALMGDRIYRIHFTYLDYLRADSKKFHAYYKFAIVRNPWDRAVSSYQYLIQGGDKRGDLYFQELFLSKYDTFDKFVLEYLDKDKIHEHVLFKPQYLYLYDHKECKVDFIGKFENLDSDFEKIMKKINIDSKLSKVNSSKRNHYITYYSKKEVKEKINDLYRKDIELFDYIFGK